MSPICINITDIWPINLCPVCGWQYADSPEKGCVPRSCSMRPVPNPTARERFEQSCAIRETLADYAHEAWAGWMRYLFEKSTRLDDGTVVIPASLVERWTRQMNTSYSKLSEGEKKSDLEEADKMMLIAGVP